MTIPGSLAQSTSQLSSKWQMTLGWLFLPLDQQERPRHLRRPSSLLLLEDPMDTFITLPGFLPDQSEIYELVVPLHLPLRISLVDSF